MRKLVSLVAALAVLLSGVPSVEAQTVETEQTNAVVIRAKGDSGEERMQLRLNRRTVASFELTTEYVDYTFTPTKDLTVRGLLVAFVNDRETTETVIRNMNVDHIIVNGVTYETEDPAVRSKGTFVNGKCAKGFRETSRLPCNGWFKYPVPKGTVLRAAPALVSDADQPGISVRARGITGTERIILKVNNKTVARWNLTDTFANYEFVPNRTKALSRVRVVLVSGGEVDGKARSAIVDHVVVNGVTIESESPTVRSKGAKTSDSGCEIGYKQRQRLSCKGWFDYPIPTGSVIGG